MKIALRSQAWQATLFCLASLVYPCQKAAAVDTIASAISLDRGFSLLYNLNFADAHQLFSSWQQQHPDDPLGPACDAAGFLFSEFNRLGVLEAHFYASLDQADIRARARLAKNPRDRDALFALTMSSGLKADYAGLIEKRNLA